MFFEDENKWEEIRNLMGNRNLALILAGFSLFLSTKGEHEMKLKLEWMETGSELIKNYLMSREESREN